MPIFRLQPVLALLDDPAWRNSPYQGEMWANARDDIDARALASGRFEDARANIPGVSAGASPWQDARLVQVVAEAAGPGGQPIPAGVVIADRQM